MLFDDALATEPRIQFDVRVPMRDGVELSADLYLPPAGDGPWPALLCRTPYDNVRQAEEALWFAARGYAVVAQDVRGRGDSDGRFAMWSQEAQDGHDTAEWIAEQPWCNGRVGVFGGSYQAYCGWAALKEGTTAIASLVSRATSGFWLLGVPFDLGTARPYWLWVFHLTGGRTLQTPIDAAALAPSWSRILRTRPLREMDAAIGRSLPVWRQMVDAEPDGELVRSLDLAAVFPDLDLPVLHVTGWFDAAQWGELRTWREMRTVSASPDRQRLVIGPWDHYGTGIAPRETGGRDFGPAAALDPNELMLGHFDRTLKDGAPGDPGEAPVRYFVMGADRWRTAADWPPPQTGEAVLHLRGGGCAQTVAGDGRLEPAAAPGAEPADTFRYDPGDPTPSSPDRDAPFTAPFQLDNRWLLRRHDVLVYTSQALAEPLEVAGSPRVVLHVESTAPDTDFHVQLCDVAPDGRSDVVAAGFVRASYRRGPGFPRIALEPGRPTELTVTLHATANAWLPGHRVRVVVASAAFPDVDRHPNTLAALGDDAVAAVADNTLHHSAAHPSRLLLPVVDTRHMTETKAVPAVTLFPMSPATLTALLAEDLDAAGDALGVTIPPQFLEEAWLWRLRLDQMRETPADEPWLVRAVVDRDSSEVVGHAGFHEAPDADGVGVVAYSILPQHRGKRYAQAALAELIAYGRAHGVRVVRAEISPDNGASHGVIGGFGFVKTGEQIDEEDGLELIYDLQLS